MTKHLSHRQSYAPIIYRLGVMNQMLIAKSLDLGLFSEIKQLQKIDEALIELLYKGTTFDFVGEIAEGKTFLVGEGNLSFTHSLTRKKRITPAKLVATTFESVDNLSPETIQNAEKIKESGALVLHGIDATRLAPTFGSMRFDNIIFQFPHTGSREPIEGHNPNFILVRDFLRSARWHLRLGGKILISAVDNPHYRGAFQFEEAAKIAGFRTLEIYPFDPLEFPGYVHTMTNEDNSAIDEHATLSTWVLKR